MFPYRKFGPRIGWTGLLLAACIGSVCPPLMAGTSLLFPGGGAYAAANDAPAFDFAGSFTIELRFQSSVAQTGCLVAKFWNNSGTPLDDSYYLLARSDDTLQVRIQTTLQLLDLKAHGALHNGQWHHVAVVFDTAVHHAELYLDGSLAASQVLPGVLRDTNQPVTLGTLLSGGSAPGTPTTFFDGRIEELRFWDTARHGEQAWCLRDVTLLENTPGLVSYYRFDEGSGSIAGDLIPPYEIFVLYGGATFSPDEPVFRSRLSGPGQCRCGVISGRFTASQSPVTVVGDSVRVPAGDSLVLQSHVLTVDSSVSVFAVEGSFRANGNPGDSAGILGQGTPSCDAAVRFSGPPITMSFTRVSGLAAPLEMLTQATLSDCRFSGNLDNGLRLLASATISGCSFESNGGTAVVIEGGLATLQSCLFLDNGRGLQSSTSLVTDSCRFANNGTAGWPGGAMQLNLDTTSRTEITNCRFEDNRADSSSGGALFVGGTATPQMSGDTIFVRGCTFVRNTADTAGAIYVRDANLWLERTEFDSNSAESLCGAVQVTATPGHVGRLDGDSLVFTNNRGPVASALLLNGTAGSGPVETHVTGSTFAFNVRSESQSGTPVAARAVRGCSSLPLLERCVLYDNDNCGGVAGAVSLESAFDVSGCELRSLTITLNRSDSAAVTLASRTVLRNSIVTANDSPRQILGSIGSVVYCLTSDTQYHGPGGSFYADPLFEDFLNRDFHLTAGSAAINRGDPHPAYDDPDGTRSDIGAFVAANFAPALQSILDVPHDNGRQVMVQWLPSPGDDPRQGIVSYSIYRRVNLVLLENFELMAEVPAAQLPGYGRIVPTLADSNASGAHYYSYFVRAQSVNPLAFWDTSLDSGYSVDNIAPSAPSLLAGQIPAGVQLRWTAVTDSDFAYYAVYRADALCDPDTVSVFALTADTSLVDSVQTGDHWYWIRAADRNGNLSPASNQVFVNLDILSTPGALTITPEGTVVRLSWRPSPGAADYRVFRSTSPDGPEEWLGSTPDTTMVIPLDLARAFFSVTAER